MATVTCPKCGTENPAAAMNCTNCRINLQYALEHRDEMEFARQHPDVLEPTEQQAAQGTVLKPMSGIDHEADSGEKKRETVGGYIGNVIFAMLFPIVVLWYGPMYLFRGEIIKGIVIILIVVAELIVVSSVFHVF